MAPRIQYDPDERRLGLMYFTYKAPFERFSVKLHMMFDLWMLSAFLAIHATSCTAAKDQASSSRNSAHYDENHLIDSATLSHDFGTTTSVNVNFSDPQVANITNHILNSLIFSTAGTRNSIHELNITGSPYLGNWPLLQSFIESAPEIRTLHWESQHPIPSSILNALKRQHPACRLYYTIPFNFREDPYDPAYSIDPDWDSYDGVDPGYWNRKALLERRTTELLPSIINSTNLFSLKAEIEYNVDDNFASLELLFQILATSTNLRELDLHLYSVGDLLGSVPFAFEFLSNPSVRFPPLEVLRMRGYDLDERSGGGDIWRYKNYDWNSNNYPPSERKEKDERSNLDVWLEIMDWSHLHTLDIRPTINILEKLHGPVLPSLRHLTFRYSDWMEGSYRSEEVEKQISSFVKETDLPLKRMNLWNIKTESWSSFLGHDEWHESLWRELESFTIGNDENTNYMDDDSFTTLIASSPRLRRLDVGKERSELSVDDSFYRTIASNPSLEHLVLRIPTPDSSYLDIGIHDNVTLMQSYVETRQIYNLFGDEKDELDPMINPESVLLLFRGLRERKVGRELEGLEVYVGNWVDRMNCDYTVMRPMVRVAHYTCWVDAEEERCKGSQTRNKGSL